MYLTSYENSRRWLDGRVLREMSYDSAQILDGQDVVTTFHGKEAVRHSPDNTLKFTVPETRGLRWLSQFGTMCGLDKTKRKAWDGEVDSHFVLSSGVRASIHTTGTFKCSIYDATEGGYYGYKIKELWVPPESRPRKKVLTKAGEAQLKAYMKGVLEKATHEAALRKLKGVGAHAFPVASAATLIYQLSTAGKPKLSTPDVKYGFRDIEHIKRAMTKARYLIADFIKAEVEYPD